MGGHLARRKRSRAGFGMGDREGRPYAGLVAEPFGCRGDACRRPCRFPMASTGRRQGVGGHLVRRKRSRAGFGMGDREGRPYAGLVAEPFGCRGDACRRPCRFPMASFGSVREAARAWDATSHEGTSYEGNDAVLDSRWATARVAPTRASSPSCSGRRGEAIAPVPSMPDSDGLVWVGTGRHKGVPY